jgi:fructose-1,6-bisphosphatase/inositol monophosphatase family enzyme
LTNWLALCREAVEDVRQVLVDLPTRVEREPVVGDGQGGDETTAVDAAAERVILERLREVDGATIVSEEVGILPGDGPWRIVVDPIDGSLNAKRGIPFFSVSIAVADGARWTTSSSATSTTSAPARNGRPNAAMGRSCTAPTWATYGLRNGSRSSPSRRP